MKFFESDIIQEEAKKMQELYVDINRMGIILTVDEKIKQLEQLFALIEVQQTMFMRVTLSDAPDAKMLLEQVRDAASLLGMNPEDVNPQFYNGLKDQVRTMIADLEKSK